MSAELLKLRQRDKRVGGEVKSCADGVARCGKGSVTRRGRGGYRLSTGTTGNKCLWSSGAPDRQSKVDVKSARRHKAKRLPHLLASLRAITAVSSAQSVTLCPPPLPHMSPPQPENVPSSRPSLVSPFPGCLTPCSICVYPFCGNSFPFRLLSSFHFYSFRATGWGL